MSKYIVISTDNRLHYLVDGIVASRPLNSEVTTYVSSGKILHETEGLTYQYTVESSTSVNGEKYAFHELVANHLAQFRLQHTMAQNDLVNIFLLENPLTEVQFAEGELWQREFQQIYDKGHDRNFCLFRIIISYDVERPFNVNCQVDSHYLRSIVESANEEREAQGFQSFVFYLDNQKCDAAAFCRDKKEHDLKLPRLLNDFMMLVSNQDFSYGIRNEITSPTNLTRVFSIGYAESMYYFPDVSSYFSMADMRDLHRHMLEAEDTLSEGAKDIERLDAERYPIGLESRVEAFRRIYGHVSYDQNIDDYPDSADKQIDDALLSLKEYIEAPDSECPPPLLRSEIYDQVKALEEDDKKATLEELAAKYEQLIDFVKTKKFQEHCRKYLKQKEEEESAAKGERATAAELGQNEGCLSKFAFWRRRELATPEPMEPAPVPNDRTFTDWIKSIKDLLDLKRQYRHFIEQVQQIKETLRSENQEIAGFALSDHSSHYYHLINLPALRQEQASNSSARIEHLVSQWHAEEEEPCRSNLETRQRVASMDYARKFSYIDWDHPFTFISKVDARDNLAAICNRLYRISSPCVHFNRVSEFASNAAAPVIYSDRPNLVEEFEQIRPHLVNGSIINVCHSKHIASKICLMQFLPMDQSILENLVDLQDNAKEGAL